MAKRNTGGRSGSRTTSPSSRSNSNKKPFSRKSDKPFKSSGGSGTGKPFRKPREENSFRAERPGSTGNSYRKFDKKDSDKSSDRGERPGKKSFSSSAERKPPYKKFDSNDSSSKPSFRGDKRTGSSGYRKFDKKDSGKPFDKEERPRYPRKSVDSSAEGKRPYKKFDSSASRPSSFKKRDDSSGYKKRPFSRDAEGDKPRKFTGENSSDRGGSRPDRPYKKFDKKDSGEKPAFKRERTNPVRSENASTSLRRERPYKKREENTDAFPTNDTQPDRKELPFKKPKSDLERENIKGSKRLDIEAPAQTGKIRLNKFIANSGVCSRREADELITMGVISVNGKTITELGYKVNPGDEVRHESTLLRAEKPVYILLNKPKGFLTTTSDPQERNTVMHLIGNAVKERVYPVGRLDRNTTGLLLLTNDGELADKLMHPSHNAKKIYKVELDRPITKGDAQQILEGVKLEEGKAMVDDLAILTEDKRTLGIEIHIGWNRVIRRIFESLNYEVVKLDRSVYAGLDKKNLGRGEWRFLNREEVVRLKHYK